jgi:hypothetical protein
MFEVFKLNGGSNRSEVGDLSLVCLGLITYASPPVKLFSRTGCERLNGYLPIALADPGKMREVVTPPAVASSYAASCVLIPSIERSQEVIGPWGEFTSKAPSSNGVDPTPICE